MLQHTHIHKTYIQKYLLASHLFFITNTTPRNIITKSKIPAMTPAILTVWSVCFSGSGSGFLVAAPIKEYIKKEKTRINILIFF